MAINAKRQPRLNGYYLGMIVAGIGAGRRLRHLRRQCAEMVFPDKRALPQASPRRGFARAPPR